MSEVLSEQEAMLERALRMFDMLFAGGTVPPESIAENFNSGKKKG